MSARAALAIHHIIPVALGGRDVASNLTTLCANCHRIVHWLATGDRSLDSHAYGLGTTKQVARQLLVLARRIRSRRLREIGSDLVLRSAVPLQTAFDAVIRRNGLAQTEATLLRRCFNRALRKIAPSDRRACSVYMVRGARFISVNANNHLALRAPAWNDERQRVDGDMILVWPQSVRPSVISEARFRRESSSRFRLIPHFNLMLTWDECLALTERDWRTYREACHDALTLVRTSRRPSNVAL